MVVPEENVLGLPTDPFAGQSMVVSEFARALYRVTGQRPGGRSRVREGTSEAAIHELRVEALDVAFDEALQKAHDEAKNKGLWKGTAAARDRDEYWTAGVAAYFDAAGTGHAPHGADRPITTREALKAYDPDLYAWLVDRRRWPTRSTSTGGYEPTLSRAGESGVARIGRVGARWAGGC